MAATFLWLLSLPKLFNLLINFKKNAKILRASSTLLITSISDSEEAYHWVTMLPNFTSIVVSLVASAIKPPRLRWIVVLMAACVLLFSVCVTLALQSPNPIFKDAGVKGEIFTVTLQTSTISVMIALFIQISTKFRDLKPEDADARIFKLGVFSQAGNLAGSILLYVFVNVLGVFKDASSHDSPPILTATHYAVTTPLSLPLDAAAAFQSLS